MKMITGIFLLIAVVVGGISEVYAQTASPTSSPTSTPTPTATSPSGAPKTGFGGE